MPCCEATAPHSDKNLSRLGDAKSKQEREMKRKICLIRLVRAIRHKTPIVAGHRNTRRETYAWALIGGITAARYCT